MIEGFKFKKKFGQNFIFDKNLIASILDKGGLDDSLPILEIGAGAGTMTQELCERAPKVVAYEIDAELKPVLDGLRLKNLTIKYQDILDVPLNVIEKDFDEYNLVANLPYYITTPIIFKFLESKKLKTMYIMVQKEVGYRLSAKAGEKEYGIPSVLVDCIGNAKVTKEISKTNFKPVPKVDSCMVKIDIKRDKYNVDFKAFSAFVQRSLAMRRKTLINNLTHNGGFDKDSVKCAYAHMSLKDSVRGEELNTGQFVRLFEYLKTKKQM
ncbi:MAG: 16S rRNA (adenine(1518)-N(6)/adenine(1519)-N(6))-dimethyltransferase RsmA [Christensenellaceae bacterium]|jgi:16S rRNA (adenine1518-N6/adenine1519-N6)-dimethyltransferase|nr:16S rRNA (adenine(1518)-N(6)/adenine(1519)-N(6))-dimethyltransferase RsmA [Christensenellaceae bacterium]